MKKILYILIIINLTSCAIFNPLKRQDKEVYIVVSSNYYTILVKDYRGKKVIINNPYHETYFPGDYIPIEN